MLLPTLGSAESQRVQCVWLTSRGHSVPASSVSGLTSSPLLPSSELFARASLLSAVRDLPDVEFNQQPIRVYPSPRSTQDALYGHAVSLLHAEFEKIRKEHKFLYHVTIYGGSSISAAKGAFARFRLWFSRCRSYKPSYIALRSKSPKGHWHYHVLLGADLPFSMDEWRSVYRDIEIRKTKHGEPVVRRVSEYRLFREACIRGLADEVAIEMCDDRDWIESDSNSRFHAEIDFAEVWSETCRGNTLRPYSSERTLVYDRHLVPVTTKYGMRVRGASRWRRFHIGYDFDGRRIRFNTHNNLRQLAEYWLSTENFNPASFTGRPLTSSNTVHISSSLHRAVSELREYRLYARKVYRTQFRLTLAVDGLFSHSSPSSTSSIAQLHLRVDTRARAVAAGPSRSIEDLSSDRFTLFRSAIALSLGREQLLSLLSGDLSRPGGDRGDGTGNFVAGVTERLRPGRRESGRDAAGNHESPTTYSAAELSRSNSRGNAGYGRLFPSGFI